MTKHEKLLAGPHLSIAMLPYPGMYLQDFVGPLTMFEALMNRDVHIVWKDTKAMTVGAGIQITPTATFDECPQNLDVLFVPGGVPGTFAMMEDRPVLEFLASRGRTAKFVTSVCTGSLILGAAGLLTGYRATSYWSTRDVLREFGATPTEGRVVIDRNRITGGGVTAGLDFGLAIIAKLRSDLYAQAVQLYVEYDPQPPFDSGSPKTAPPEARAFLDDMFGSLVSTARETAVRAQKRLG
jgi:cyclohexyl-isocyanide hydratase